MITAIFDEVVTDPLKQSGAVLFLDDKFAYFAYGKQQKVEALYFLRFLVQLNLSVSMFRVIDLLIGFAFF
jgi:hypothetical protein